MSLSIGIVGLPNVGKSTLFNALTQKSVPAENYPFCTIDPSVGVVAVPDDRLAALSQISGSQKIIPAAVEFVDIAGLVEGASQGEGLGNKFLANIREVDAILHMVRIFAVEDESGDKQHHVYGDINPLRDIQVINMELIISDMESIDKRIDKIARDVKRGDKEAIAENDVCHKMKAHLEAEQLAITCDLTKEEKAIMKSFHLLTYKPMIFGLNKKTGGKNLDSTDTAAFEALTTEIETMGFRHVVIDAKTEHELSDFEGEEKKEMRVELDHNDDGIDELIQQSYCLLGLMTYFTTGEVETRAWTVKKGSTAPEAGRAIHNDFYEKFIRADVVSFDDLVACGSNAEARAKGKLSTEGKEYVVQDGDVVVFKV